MKAFIPATITAAAVALGGIGYAVWNAPVATAPAQVDVLAVNTTETLPDVNLPLSPLEAMLHVGVDLEKGCELYVKGQMKDPSSYQRVSIDMGYIESHTTPNQVRVAAKVTYRGKNSLGAYGIDSYTCSRDVYKGRVDGETKYGILLPAA